MKRGRRNQIRFELRKEERRLKRARKRRENRQQQREAGKGRPDFLSRRSRGALVPLIEDVEEEEKAEK